MVSISGRPVIAAGVVQFVSGEIVDIGCQPNVIFKHGNDGLAGNKVSGTFRNNTFEVSSELSAGGEYAGRLQTTVNGVGFRLDFIMDRITEIEVGAFYSVHYTLTKDQ